MLLDRTDNSQEHLIKALWLNRTTAEVDLMLRLLRLRLERTKDRLVAERSEVECRRLQGQAEAYRDLITILTRQPIALPGQPQE